VVGLDRGGTLHVGESARNQLQAMPDRTVAEVKRLMGTGAEVTLGDRRYRPQEISALVLRALKADAERFLDGPVEEAVITVPAYFTDAARQATKDAGDLAGLTVERILNEPTAAALAYGLDHLCAEQHVLVYDLGGGTFDVSVLELFRGVLEVKASAGNDRLGGTDLDAAVVAWLFAEFEQQHGLDLRSDLQVQARFKAAAEQAKVELSVMEVTTVLVPFLAARAGQPLSLEVELSRAKLEALVGDLIRATLPPIEAALRDARLKREAITDLVLVGGSSRMPMVRRLVSEFFGKEPRGGVHPDEAIALGAAIQAGLKSGRDPGHDGIMITDVNPFTLGVEVMGFAGRQPVKGLFSPIIPRNTAIPVSRTEIYSSTRDGQDAVDVRIYQGESRLCAENVFLDQYQVQGMPTAPAGVEKVAVTFTYDVNGILHVATKIVSTGHEARLVVDRSAQRLDEAARRASRARLDTEFGATGPVAAPGAPGGATSSAPGSTPARAAFVAAARARSTSTPAALGERLRFLADELEKAMASGLAAEADRLERELTSALFEQAVDT
jgi:molecular chaperone DnaK